MAKLITVFGATGAQGGPVARALLRSGFRVRAVTRSADSDKAKALRDAGAEVVTGSVTDPEAVRAAIAGSYGAYIVTVISPDEAKVGKAAADECKKAGLKHVVYSGLDSVIDKIGKPCLHFDSKSAVEKHLDEIGVPNTSVRFPFYFENFAGFLQYDVQSDGSYSVTMPMDGPMDTMSTADGAPIVVEAFKSPEKYIGKKVAMSAGRLTMDQYLAIVSNVTGKTVKYNQISFEQFANQPGNPLASEMSAMFEYYSKVNTPYDEKFTRSINPNALTFQQWAEQNKDQFKL